MYTCVHGWHAGRKWIDYAYALSDALHSAGCIKMGAGKWRSIHFRQDRRKIVFFRFFSQNTNFTFRLLQRFDAMGPVVDSCMGKMKDMYTRSKFYDLKVSNLQEINKNVIPSRSVLE